MLLNKSDVDIKPVILVVEDEIVVRSAIATYLRDSDFTVLEAASAAEAVAVLASEATVDVVVTDVTIPGEMDGLGLVGWIQQHELDIPVLVTSGAGDLLDISGKVPVKHCVRKPYSCGDIEQLIRESLQKS